MQDSIINLILQARDNYTDLSNYSTTLACCIVYESGGIGFLLLEKKCV